MPWVVREAVRDINRAVGRRWHAIDPLLPDPATLPAGCGEPLVVTADNGRVAGLGVCVHQHIAPRLAEPDLGRGRPLHPGPPAGRPGRGRPGRPAARPVARPPGRDRRDPGPGHLGQRGLAEPGRHRRPRPAQARPPAADGDRRQDPAEPPPACRRPAARRPRRHDPRGRPGRRGAGARPGTTADPLRHAVRRAGLAGQHRPAGPRRDPHQPGPPGRPGPGWPSGTAARSACWSRSRRRRPAGSPG